MAFFALCATLPGCRGPLAPAVCYRTADSDPARGPLIVVGDFQRTSLAERLFGREANDRARRRLVDAIVAESPSAIAIVGDLVFDGASAVDWAWFDRVCSPLVEADPRRAPSVHVALGNHDYWGSDAAARDYLRQRFPALADRTWFTRRHGPLALVFLDTNEATLGFDAWRRQSEWLHRTIYAYEADDSVRGVLVFSHHPPFTNSDVTGDEEHVQRAFLASFVRAKKTLAFFSGHAHTYEHFVKRGKHFIVTGGGGAPRVYGRNVDAKHADRIAMPYPRPFHYSRVAVTESGVDVAVRGFDRGEHQLRTVETFSLPFPR